MSKKIKVTTDEDFFIDKEDKIEFDSIALSIIKGEGKKRKVIEIPFNSVSLKTGTGKVIAEGENIWEGKYEFEIAAVKKGLFDVD